jgi:hypothetical protein
MSGRHNGIVLVCSDWFGTWNYDTQSRVRSRSATKRHNNSGVLRDVSRSSRSATQYRAYIFRLARQRDCKVQCRFVSSAKGPILAMAARRVLIRASRRPVALKRCASPSLSAESVCLSSTSSVTPYPRRCRNLPDLTSVSIKPHGEGLRMANRVPPSRVG